MRIYIYIYRERERIYIYREREREYFSSIYFVVVFVYYDKSHASYTFIHSHNVLQGESKKTIRVTDAMPLFHYHTLSPMTEFAFDCVRQHLKSVAKGKSVVGVYASNACNSQDKVSSVATHLLSKIDFEHKIGVQILGRKMTEIGRDGSRPPIRLFASGGSSVRLRNWPETRDQFVDYVLQADENGGVGGQYSCMDFDDHFDDIKNADWRNLHLNSEITEPTSEDKSIGSAVAVQDDGGVSISADKNISDMD